jgi:hypothetical protein
MGADDPRHLPGVARDLECDLVVFAQALGKELQLLGGYRDSARRADLTRLGDRDLAEVAVDIETDRSHRHALLLVFGLVESRWTTTSTDSCSRHNRAGRRGGH